jgi:excisionase family DNA binding protein
VRRVVVTCWMSDVTGDSMSDRARRTAACMDRTPTLLTPTEVANLLRTSRKAIYTMIERAQLPGVVRIGRRVLVRQDALVDWLRQKSTPSLER